MIETETKHMTTCRLTTSVSKIASLFRYLESKGIDRSVLLNASNINLSVLSSPDNMLNAEQIRNLFHKAAALSGDHLLGLHLGQDIKSFSNILAYILMNCSTMKEAFTKFIRYQKLVDGLNHMEIHPGKKHLTIIYSSYDELCDTDPFLVDYRLSSLRHYPEILAQQPMVPVEASFRYPCPDDFSEYLNVFQCKLSFGSTNNALIYPNDILDIPIPDPNPDLLALFEHHAETILSKLEGQESCSQKVSGLIMSMIRAETPSIDDISKKLSIGKRSLQLQLQKEGTSFSKLLNDIKREMATHYLKDCDYSISEISYLLGYSEPSVFHRNFKKWTDFTPGEYRSRYESEYELS